MNVGDTTSAPTQRPPVPNQPVEAAHVKQRQDQQKTENRDPVNAAAKPPQANNKAPHTGKYVDLSA